MCVWYHFSTPWPFFGPFELPCKSLAPWKHLGFKNHLDVHYFFYIRIQKMFLKGSLVSPYFGIFSYLKNIFENIFNFRLRIFSLTCEKFRILGQIWGKLTLFWHLRIYFSFDQNALRIFCKLRTFSLLNSSQKIKNTSGWFYQLIFL